MADIICRLHCSATLLRRAIEMREKGALGSKCREHACACAAEQRWKQSETLASWKRSAVVMLMLVSLCRSSGCLEARCLGNGIFSHLPPGDPLGSHLFRAFSQNAHCCFVARRRGEHMVRLPRRSRPRFFPGRPHAFRKTLRPASRFFLHRSPDFEMSLLQNTLTIRERGMLMRNDPEGMKSLNRRLFVYEL